MCGIIGYIGKRKNALNILVSGLKALEYRGYDSSGIAFFKDNDIEIIKKEGKVDNLVKEINFDIETNIGIGHTRWATHGVANKVNAHPHSCEKITLVHNGIIENYEELKNDLINKGYSFISDTDSEVIAVLLNDIYKSKNIVNSIIELKKLLRGSYALVIMCSDCPNNIFAIRKDSPLVISKNDCGSFIGSDISSFLKYSCEYSILDEGEIAILSDSAIEVFDDNLKETKKDILLYKGSNLTMDKNGFDHFMLKEIFEEKDVIKRIISDYDSFDSFVDKLSFLDKYKNIDIIGCGSAYNVGLIGKYLFEEYGNIPVNVEIASEYRYKKNFLSDDSLAIFISQSGETADTIASLRKVNSDNIDTLGIVNVVGSSIARESKKVIYTNAGTEVSVATTKAFVAQLVVVTLISLYLGYKSGKFNKNYILKILNDLSNLDCSIDKILKINYKKYAEKLYKCEKIFFIGRSYDYAVAIEGALKLKEISYIHSEAYAAGELKHGTISLIEENTPVICLLTDDNIIDKTVSNVKEVKSRGAYVISVSNEDISCDDDLILIPTVEKILFPILEVIPLQILAYEVAKLRGCDIDKPRNLAKSVTVE